MLEEKEFKRKVILVSAATSPEEKEDLEEHTQELGRLANTLNMEVLDNFMVFLRKITPATFIGEGKVQEIKRAIQRTGAKMVIVDNDLKGSQERNLEQEWDVNVTTRTGIILEIFSRHARTKEAKTQVELARLEYLSTRLVGRWDHLSRQAGATGVRAGMGEKQVEIDRRLVDDRIANLKDKLQEIEKQKDVRSQHRKDEIQVAIVGYTNAGKSTLMKALTDAEVLVENQLFATLDTTVRKCEIDENHKILLSDTVGFIRKLPHRLVASFKSTLKEAREADLILKIADISSEYRFDHLKTVNKILKELDAHKIPSFYIFNKIDKCDKEEFKKVRHEYPDAIFISALKKMGIRKLKDELLQFLKEREIRIKLSIPAEAMKSVVELRKHSQVIEKEKYRDGEAHIDLVCYENLWNKLRPRLSDRIKIKSREKVLEDN